MNKNIDLEKLSKDELEILIKIQDEKIDKLNKELKDELNNLKELLKKIDK